MVRLSVSSCFVLLALHALVHHAASIEISRKLWGLNYNPRREPTWKGPSGCPTQEDVDADLALLVGITTRVRIYSLKDCDQGLMLLKGTKTAGLSLWLGLWVGPDPAIFQSEFAYLKNLVEKKDSLNISFDNVIGFHVGSEAIYRKEITAEQAASNVKDVKTYLASQGFKVPVTFADIGDVLVRDDVQVAIKEADLVSANGFPYWEGIAPEKAVDYFLGRMTGVVTVTTTGSSRTFMVGETGWPNQGGTFGANAVTTADAQKRYYQEFTCKIEPTGWTYWWFAAFDEEWKLLEEGVKDGPEAHWGIFYSNRTVKPWFVEPFSCDVYNVSSPSVTTSTSLPPTNAIVDRIQSGSSAPKSSGASASGEESSGTSGYLIAGLVLGAVACIALILAGVIFYRNQKQGAPAAGQPRRASARTQYDKLSTPSAQSVPSARDGAV